MATESNTKEESAFSINTFYIIAGGVFLIWGIYGAVGAWSFSGTWSSKGLFGDMFGGLNALFSGLAFAGVICAILMQRTELQLQRKDLKLQRKIMEAQVDESRQLAKQASAQTRIMERNHQIEYEPLFVCGEATISPLNIDIPVHNLGGKAVNLFIKEAPEGYNIKLLPYTFVEKNGHSIIRIAFQDKKLAGIMSFIFCYHNVFDEPSEFQCHYDHNNFQRKDFFVDRLVYKGKSQNTLANFFDEGEENSK